MTPEIVPSFQDAPLIPWWATKLKSLLVQGGGIECDEPWWMLTRRFEPPCSCGGPMLCALPWLLDCRLEGLLCLSYSPECAGGTECCHTGCSGPLCVLKSMFFSLLTPTVSWAGTISMCVFPSHCKNNYPLSAVRVFLFPLIYGGKELIWEDESEVIELQGGCISWLFLSLFLPCTVPHGYQCFGLPGNMH